MVNLPRSPLAEQDRPIQPIINWTRSPGLGNFYSNVGCEWRANNVTCDQKTTRARMALLLPWLDITSLHHDTAQKVLFCELCPGRMKSLKVRARPLTCKGHGPKVGRG